jgi:hypothetical protein
MFRASNRSQPLDWRAVPCRGRAVKDQLRESFGPSSIKGRNGRVIQRPASHRISVRTTLIKSPVATGK